MHAANVQGSLVFDVRESSGLWRVQFDGTREVGRERLLVDRNERYIDVRMGPDGYLYLFTDTPYGKVLLVCG